jgi:beta-phosphoglucomutase
MKKGIIFDMDGVLIDAMPSHAEAMSRAIKERTNHEIDKRNIYLLEGMPGSNLIKEIFEREHFDRTTDVDDKMVQQIGQRKEEIFKEIQNAQVIDGARELVEDLKRKCGKLCIKAVVSGPAREEVETILDRNIGTQFFDVIITGDDTNKGKPNSIPLEIALKKMDMRASDVIVVENSPLGVEAAIRAKLKYIIVLNNTPLRFPEDFEDVTSDEFTNVEKFTFEDTKSAGGFLRKWCCTTSRS